MELLLGLPPMCQYDAASDAILDWDEAPRERRPLRGDPAGREVDRRDQPATAGPRPAASAAADATEPGRALAELAEESAAMDFTHADRAPADALNRIIWKTVKGVDSEMPPTPHRPVPVVAAGAGRGTRTPAKPKEDDDD